MTNNSGVSAAAWMSSPVRTVGSQATMAEAQNTLLRYGHSGIVVALGETIGILSRQEIDLAVHHGLGKTPVQTLMTYPVETVDPDTPMSKVQTLLIEKGLHRLPVVRAGHIVGILTRSDLLRYLHGRASDSHFEDRQLHALWERLHTRHGILKQAAAVADQLGIQLFLVGGAVRDLLLNHINPSQHPINLDAIDLDLVADGSCGLDPQGWAVQLGQALQKKDPDIRLDVHSRYQTVVLTWPNGRWIDVASTRVEFYPYPGANPEVELGSLPQDLARRDFTINALALRLNGPQAGQIVDQFGGLDHLQAKQLHILHPNSFIEDPSRMVRAARFAVRLQAQLSPLTLHWMQGSLNTGRLDGSASDRFKQELSIILDSSFWPTALQHLGSWGSLRCLQAELVWDPGLIGQVRRVGQWYHHWRSGYGELENHPLWQLRLERILGSLPPDLALETGSRLHLTQSGLERLGILAALHTQVQAQLSQPLLPSQVCVLWDPYPVPLLMVLAAGLDPQGRRILYRYLHQWRQAKPPLNGHDLKKLGYTPGPHFQSLLTQLRHAWLDGVIGDPDSAREWIQNKGFNLLIVQS